MPESALPPISIVVPTFNRCTSLRALLPAILSSLQAEDELIVVDDASTDASRQYLSSLSSPQLKVFYLQVNSGGPAIPRNTGIRHASNNWICFCDSDDLWPIEKTRVLRQYLSSHNYASSDFLYHSSYDSFSGRHLTKGFPCFYGLIANYYVLTRMAIPMSTFVCNKIRLFQLLGSDWFPVHPAFVAIEDSVFTHKLHFLGATCRHIPDMTTSYNSGSLDSISGEAQYWRKYQYLKSNPYKLPHILSSSSALYVLFVLLIRYPSIRALKLVSLSLPFLPSTIIFTLLSYLTRTLKP